MVNWIILAIAIRLDAQHGHIFGIIASVDQYTVGFADIQQTELLFTQHGTVRLDEIVKLHFFRILGSNTIDVDLVVTNLDRVARHTNTSFDIILAFVDRPIDHITEIRFIQLDSFPPVLFYQVIIIRVLNLQCNRITCRKVEHDNIIPLHMPETFHPFIVPLRPVQIRLAVEKRQCVLYQREGNRRIRYTRSVAELTDK